MCISNYQCPKCDIYVWYGPKVVLSLDIDDTRCTQWEHEYLGEFSMLIFGIYQKEFFEIL